MNVHLKDKIWGSFAALAAGDALGMPFHELTPDEIKNRCGGMATTFYPIFEDEFIHLDFKKGQVTDDTILTLVTASAILKYKGQLSSEQFVTELGNWVKKNQTVWQYANVFGPSTKVAFDQLLNDTFNGNSTGTRTWCYTGTSNGAVMRVSPAGWAFPGNLHKAVELACAVILPTHPTDAALSAAAGQAAAVSEALTDSATAGSVIDAALEGLRLGESIGASSARVTAQRYPLANVELALELATKAKDPFEAAYLVRRLIGSHFHVAETMATVLAVFYAAKGDTQSSMLAALNNGGDSDTITSITGALGGALNGIDSIPADWVKMVEDVNDLKCEQLAEDFAALQR